MVAERIKNMKKIKFGFYGSMCQENKTDFSCMTYGFSDTSILTNQCRIWSEEFEGVISSGTYEDCIDTLQQYTSLARAVIVFVTGCGKEDTFIAKLSKLVKCPIVGGTAAASENAKASRLYHITNEKPAEEAAIFIITDNRFEFEAKFENIHAEILEEVMLELSSPRRVRKINGIPASDFMKRQKRKLGIPETDCEHMTLCTMEHVNAHMNYDDGEQIGFGRDMKEKMLLCYAEPASVQKKIEDFFNDEHAIVFGCAGLRSILDHPFNSNTLGAFLFGEIMTVNGHGEFGNLMLSKLVVKRS